MTDHDDGEVPAIKRDPPAKDSIEVGQYRQLHNSDINILGLTTIFRVRRRGTKPGGGKIRYETSEVYDQYSR